MKERLLSSFWTLDTAKPIPIRGVLGDSRAAVLGHGVFEKVKVKAIYGTGSSLMTLCDAPQTGEKRVSTTFAWKLDRIQYAYEGNITVTGSGGCLCRRIGLRFLVLYRRDWEGDCLPRTRLVRHWNGAVASVKALAPPRWPGSTALTFLRLDQTLMKAPCLHVRRRWSSMAK